MNDLQNKTEGLKVYKVDCPNELANSQLNGLRCFITKNWGDVIEVLLLEGKYTGREWQLRPNHIKAV